MDDLTYLVGPLTEESIVRSLQVRFQNCQFETLIGPHLICINPCDRRSRPPHTLLDAGCQSVSLCNLVSAAVSQHADTAQPQVILVSGESGSGKTHYAMSALHQLYCAAGGGPGTDAFKYLSAAVTVLAALTSAAIPSNPDSSCMGMYMENLTSDCVIYRTRIHCLFMDQARVTNVSLGERNYHIFYYMLAGLTAEERVKLHLAGHSLHSLRYLGNSAEVHTRTNAEDKMLFEAWKSALAVVGIPVWDVLRVLAAVLLLGNIHFEDTAGLELELVSNNEMKAVAALLGVPGVSLYRGFSTRTRDSHGQLCHTITDAQSANASLDGLARALYYRMVGAVVRRVNSSRRGSSHCTQSTGSQESRASNVNVNNGKSWTSEQNNHKPSLPSYLGSDGTRGCSEGFLGVLDLYGFNQAEVKGLEQLCSNLCAEAMQHYYNSHMFRGPISALSDEGLSQPVDVQYFNNTPVIQLISAQNTGILSLLDGMSLLPSGNTDTFMQDVKTHHTTNDYFFEPLNKAEQHVFGIRHFTGRVVYSASNFLTANGDRLPDDIVCVFSRSNCNFGFVSYLFSADVKASMEEGQGPCGILHRVVPMGQMETSSPRESEQTLSADFQSRLENLLKSMAPARPHFIRCLRSTEQAEAGMFDAECVLHQIRSLQVTPTVQLLAAGLPHRMRYRVFNVRYGLFLPSNQRNIGTSQDECHAILTEFLHAMDQSHLPYVSTQWTFGRKHIFFSEGTRQSLEVKRCECQGQAATCIQAWWRGSRVRKTHLHFRSVSQAQCFSAVQSPRPSLPPRGERTDSVEPSVLQYLAQINGIQLNQQPPLPPPRQYSVCGNIKIPFPHLRTLRHHYTENCVTLHTRDVVRVVGPSEQRGKLKVVHCGRTFHLPSHMLLLQPIDSADSTSL
ncbi:uncharacterized protein LOC143293130 [Babylonia areolata]|uniref:uncharacterized protein LOC143293130 n=1 Tax=Babylonia areolata TaxID=304850 RepID=UPI003FD06575